MAYRKAKCIELHEANTVITLSTERYGSTALAARHPRANRPAFSLPLAEIDHLAARFGLRPRSDAGEAALDVLRAYYEVPANEPSVTITSLECDVLGPNLVEIRVETRWEEDQPETAGAVEAITHSGAFTIWWAAEPAASAEELFAVAEAHPTIPLEAEIPTLVENEPSEIGVLPPKVEDKER